MMRFAIALVLLFGCASADESLQREQEARHKATEIWNSAMTVVNRAVVFWEKKEDGPAPYSADELVRAVEFLEALTHIRGVTIGRYGAIPDESMAELSNKWKVWYSRYGDRLRYDDSSRRVIVTNE